MTDHRSLENTQSRQECHSFQLDWEPLFLILIVRRGVFLCIIINLLLAEILKGGVKMSHNPLLCNAETIHWWDIVDKDSNPSMLFKMDNVSSKCM